MKELKTPLRWGIIAPGIIAGQFARGLEAVDGAVLYAVGSRDRGRAEHFANTHHTKGRPPVKAYGSYEEIAGDPDVDAVYIASPHPFHMDQALLCLENKKPVLCEKPFTVNAKQAETVINAARKHNCFCMEAMWSRYVPALVEVKKRIDKGELGSIRMIRGDLSFSKDVPPSHRLVNPDLAGGALLDVGIYVLSVSSFFTGSLPVEVTGLAEMGATGVDIQESISCMWENGVVGSLTAGLNTRGPVTMEIIGTKGVITLERMFFFTENYSFMNERGIKTFEKKHLVNGYEYEAMEVQRCLEKGLVESPAMPLDETLGLMKIMDKLRGDWGLKYPFE